MPSATPSERVAVISSRRQVFSQTENSSKMDFSSIVDTKHKFMISALHVLCYTSCSVGSQNNIYGKITMPLYLRLLSRLSILAIMVVGLLVLTPPPVQAFSCLTDCYVSK